LAHVHLGVPPVQVTRVYNLSKQVTREREARMLDHEPTNPRTHGVAETHASPAAPLLQLSNPRQSCVSRTSCACGPRSSLTQQPNWRRMDRPSLIPPFPPRLFAARSVAARSVPYLVKTLKLLCFSMATLHEMQRGFTWLPTLLQPAYEIEKGVVGRLCSRRALRTVAKSSPAHPEPATCFRARVHMHRVT